MKKQKKKVNGINKTLVIAQTDVTFRLANTNAFLAILKYYDLWVIEIGSGLAISVIIEEIFATKNVPGPSLHGQF